MGVICPYIYFMQVSITKEIILGKGYEYTVDVTANINKPLSDESEYDIEIVSMDIYKGSKILYNKRYDIVSMAIDKECDFSEDLIMAIEE